MKPIMPSAILKDSSASFARNNSFVTNNRYNALRDNSQSDSRSRSPSVKRKANDNAYANAVKKSLVSKNGASRLTGITVSPPPPQAAISAENLEIIELNSAKINSICEKLHETILAIPEENPVCPILRDLCAVIHIQSENTKIIVDAIRHSATPPNALGPDKMEANLAYTLSDTEMESDSEPFTQMVSLGRIPKARNALFPDGARGRQPRTRDPATSSQPISRAADVSPSVTPTVQRFRDLVAHAEKSTVIFNLDMGRVPVINRNTMCAKATTAITAMAAAAEDRPANNPSRDTVDIIDDALSVADNVSFFGSTTKSVKGNSDKSGAYCTIPVCYTFPDKETRVKAEKVLRSRCKVSCATPYPQSLRECMKKVLESGRRARPDDFCSVSLDLPKLSLKVSWRSKGTAEWSRYDTLIPIPEAAIASPTRVPEGGFHIDNLPLGAANHPPRIPSPPPVVRPVSVREASSFFDTLDSTAPAGNPP